MVRANQQGAYGQRLGNVFRLKPPPTLITHTLNRTTIAVTQIVCDTENNGLTTPIPTEDAFLATIQIRACPRHELWVDGRPQKTGYLRAGALSIYDLRRNPIANSVSPFHNLHFYLPRKTMNAIADSDGAAQIDEFVCDPGLGTEDRVLVHLSNTLLSAFARPQETSTLFVDHVTVAVASHLMRIYGNKPGKPARATARLSSREEERIKQLLASRPDGNVTIAELASACDLPVGKFAAAFRLATGVTPCHWLEMLRLTRARDMLARRNLTMADVAAATGFAGPEHLARALARSNGRAALPWREYRK